jgi:hypothetical protein
MTDMLPACYIFIYIMQSKCFLAAWAEIKNWPKSKKGYNLPQACINCKACPKAVKYKSKSETQAQ